MDNQTEQERVVSKTSKNTDGCAKTVPDGGWGWVIVLASGFVYMSLFSFEKCITLFYRQLRSRYAESASATAVVMSLTSLLRSAGSPIASELLRRFGYKVVGITSSIFIASSFLLAAFSPKLVYLYFIHSVPKGLGVAMYVMTSYGIITEYFDKNKGKAIALNTCFLGIGGLIGPMWIITSFSEYGYFGTMLIMTGLSLNIIPATLCFRSLKNLKNIETRNTEITEREPECSEKPFLEKDSPLPKVSVETDSFIEVQNTIYECQIQCENREVTIDDNPRSFDQIKSESRCTQFLRTTGLRNLSTPRLLAHMILSISYAYIHGTTNTFTAGLAKEKHFSEDELKFLMSLINGLEILFRLGSGFLLDYFGNHRPLVYSALMMLFGTIGTILPVLQGKILSICIWVVYQGLAGVAHSHLITVASDLVRRADSTSAIGLVRFFNSFGYVLVPMTAGFLRDITGSYKYSFQLAGSQLIIFAGICVGMDVWKICSRKKH